MANYKGHLAGALVIYGLVLLSFALYYVPIIKLLQWLLFTLAGALFPDIDIKSKGQQYFYKVLLVVVLTGLFYKAYQSVIALCLFAFLPLLVKHRGIFHQLWFLIMLVVIASESISYLLPGYRTDITVSSFFFLLGILSHLWLDRGFKGLLKVR